MTEYEKRYNSRSALASWFKRIFDRDQYKAELIEIADHGEDPATLSKIYHENRRYKLVDEKMLRLMLITHPQTTKELLEEIVRLSEEDGEVLSDKDFMEMYKNKPEETKQLFPERAKVAEIRTNPKSIEELYAMYKEVVSFAELHDISIYECWCSENRQVIELEAMIEKLEENGVYMLSQYGGEYAPENCRLLIADREDCYSGSEVEHPVIFGWNTRFKRFCVDGDWPKLEMVVGDIIFDKRGVSCPLLSEVKGKIWQFSIANVPKLRKFEQLKWMERKSDELIHSLLHEREIILAEKQRKSMGHYTPEEIEKYNIPHEKVIGLLNDMPFILDNSWKNLQYIQGPIVIPQNTTIVLPACTSVEGGIKAQSGSTVNLPVCTSVKGYVVAHSNAHINLLVCESVERHIDAGDKAVISLPACTRVGDNVIIHNDSNVELPACSHIGGDIISYGNAATEFRSLSHVSGNVSAEEDSVIILPTTATVEGVIKGNDIIRKDKEYKNKTIEVVATETQAASVQESPSIQKEATAGNTLVRSALDVLDSISKNGRALIGDVSESGDFKYIVSVDGESMERKGRLEGDTVLLYPSNSDKPVISIKDGVVTNLTEKEQGKGIKR